jgi:hypothetical protein
MTDSIHEGEITGVAEPRAQSRTDTKSTVGHAAKPQATRHRTRTPRLSRDGWIGLVLLLAAIVATISMAIIHRIHVRQQETRPPAIGEESFPPPARTYLPLPTLGPNQPTPPTSGPNPRAPLTFILHPSAELHSPLEMPPSLPMFPAPGREPFPKTNTDQQPRRCGSWDELKPPLLCPNPDPVSDPN